MTPEVELETAESAFTKSLFVNGRGKPIFVEPQVFTPSSLGSDVEDVKRVDINAIALSSSSYIIAGKPEYGRTTLAKAIRLKLEQSGSKAIYQSAIGMPNYRGKLVKLFGESTPIKKPVLVLDDVDLEADLKLVREIVGLQIFSRIIILTSYERAKIGKSIPFSIESIDFIELQLFTLTRQDVRTLTLLAFDTSDDEYASFIVEKVYGDLTELCIPLTPPNIILYLQVLNYEDTFTPINRIEIADKYLAHALRTASSDYSDVFTSQNKYDLIASFVHHLLCMKSDLFTEAEWIIFCRDFAKNTLSHVPAEKVLRDMREGRIILKAGDFFFFKFRLFYIYFVGHYLNNNEERLSALLSDGTVTSISGLAEVITAKTSKRQLVLECLVGQLEDVIFQFQQEFIDDAFDPFEEVIWPITADEEETYWKPLQQRLEMGPKSSTEIDQIRSDIPLERRSENQRVLFDRYEDVERRLVRIHVELAKALKNADGVHGPLRVRTAHAVLKAHKIVFQVAFLHAPHLMQEK